MAGYTDVKRAGGDEGHGTVAISAKQHLCARRLAHRVLTAPPMRIGRRDERADGKVPRRAK